MVLLLTLACADIAFTLGGEAAARPTAWPDSGGDTSGVDTSADDTDDTSSEGVPPLASIYERGDIVGTSSQYAADWLSAGDLNGDGIDDMVASVFGASSWTAGNLAHDFDLVLSDGSGGWDVTTVSIGLLGDLLMGTAVADFDGDGLGDVAVARTTGITLFRFDGTTLTDQVDFAVGQARFVRAGDLDGDGAPDLVSLLVGEALVLLNDGTGGFSEGPRVATLNTNLYPASSNQIRLGDFDADGNLDLFTTGDPWYGTPIQVNLGVGDGTFGPAITSFPDTPDVLDVVVGDFDGDGANEVGFYDSWMTDVYVGEWTGTISSPVAYGEPFYGTNWVQQADVDGDGDQDILGYDGFDGAVLQQGSTGLSWLPPFNMIDFAGTGMANCEYFVPADANGDDCADLFVFDMMDGYRVMFSRAEGCAGVDGGDTDTEDTEAEDTETVDTADTDRHSFTDDGEGDARRRPGCASVDGSALGAVGVLLAALGARRRRA